MENYHVVYIPCEDLNLDAEVMKIRWAQDDMTIEARQHFDNSNEDELLDVRLVMETYDIESNKINACMEKTGRLTYQEMIVMIRNEVENWKGYDEWFEPRIKTEVDNAEKEQLAAQSAKKGKKASRKATRRLAFAGPKKKDHKASVAGPKVRVVTALDHTNDAQDEANQALVKTMTVQRALRNEEQFMMTLQVSEAA